MRKKIITATSVLALLSGAAIAQTTSQGTASPGTAMPGATAPTTGGPTATEMNQTGASNSSASTATTSGAQMASADKLLGKNVYGQNDEKLGEVSDVILDSNGQAKQLVISSGGFLGIGAKQVAIDYGQAKWDQQQDRLQLSGLTRDDVRNMPEYQYSDTTTSLNRSRAGSSTNNAASPAATGVQGQTGSGASAPK